MLQVPCCFLCVRRYGDPNGITRLETIMISVLTIFTSRCTLVQSAVLRSHVVCLSVCDVGGLWSHLLEFFRNNFAVS